MRQRKIGTLALTAGLCLLAMACGGSDSTEDEGAGSIAPVGEAADEVLLGGRTSQNPSDPDPWGGGSGGQPDPWGQGYPGNPYDPWGQGYPGGQYDPWGQGYPGGQYDPWGNSGPGGYGTPGGYGGYGGYGTPGGYGGYGTPGGYGGYGTPGGYGGYGTPGGYGGYGTPGGGYGGSGGVGYQGTRQIQASIGNGLPPGVSTVAWVSNWRGGINGADYSIPCPAGQVATGFHGRADVFVDRIGLVCAEVLPGGTLGTENLFGPVGGEGGDYFIDKCPPGYAVAGFSGRSDTLVDQLRLVCDTVAGAPLVYGPMFGGIAGNPWTDVSPGRFFLTEIRGRSGERIDALQGIHRYVVP